MGARTGRRGGTGEMRFGVGLFARMLVLMTGALLGASCGGSRAPSSPGLVSAPTTSPAEPKSFIVGGIVQSAGRPIPGAHVAVQGNSLFTFIGGEPPEVTTDTAGHYEFRFAITETRHGPCACEPAVDLMFTPPEGSDLDFYRTFVPLNVAQRSLNVVLQPKRYMKAGETASVSIGSENGLCWDLWSIASYCGRITVRVAAPGMLTIEAAALKKLSKRLFIAADGSDSTDVITVPVDAGTTEVFVEVGLDFDDTPAEVLVKSSFTSP